MAAALIPDRPLRIGLTGGIGSGKSTVAAMLAAHGAWVIDTDALARELTAPRGAALAPIAERFGADMVGPDGALDRARMRARVFADPAAKAALEAILHPMIRQLTQARAAAGPPDAVRVFDVPLLVESGRWREQVHRILVVDCRVETQVERVMRRNGWPESQVRAVIAAQASREARRAVADAVILNDGIGLEALQAEVDAVWSRWVSD
ncbi:dephospho-CoA kinase [Leptothrix discophora]|uniref:Dephospho-CoA kinase n=1 Tax=Leptothrix discophora TaxID=89 RepID=A0ABT9FZV4_LEPDI|nr:dephospho-CoA kinase [Leptothrix discophora]MDP4299761.1 dephospho-CoA kinase [Leptothrix discophora]